MSMDVLEAVALNCCCSVFLPLAWREARASILELMPFWPVAPFDAVLMRRSSGSQHHTMPTTPPPGRSFSESCLQLDSWVSGLGPRASGFRSGSFHPQLWNRQLQDTARFPCFLGPKQGFYKAKLNSEAWGRVNLSSGSAHNLHDQLELSSAMKHWQVPASELQVSPPSQAT